MADAALIRAVAEDAGGAIGGNGREATPRDCGKMDLRRLDFAGTVSIRMAMDEVDLEDAFDRLIELLETATDLCSRVDRGARTSDIVRLCRDAADLAEGISRQS